MVHVFSTFTPNAYEERQTSNNMRTYNCSLPGCGLSFKAGCDAESHVRMHNEYAGRDVRRYRIVVTKAKDIVYVPHTSNSELGSQLKGSGHTKRKGYSQRDVDLAVQQVKHDAIAKGAADKDNAVRIAVLEATCAAQKEAAEARQKETLQFNEMISQFLEINKAHADANMVNAEANKRHADMTYSLMARQEGSKRIRKDDDLFDQ